MWGKNFGSQFEEFSKAADQMFGGGRYTFNNFSNMVGNTPWDVEWGHVTTVFKAHKMVNGVSISLGVRVRYKPAREDVRWNIYVSRIPYTDYTETPKDK